MESKIKVNLIVYLAGGITGLTKEQAFNWRHEATQKLETLGVKCYNPLASDDFEKYSDKKGKFTSGDIICYHRDKFMVKKSDIILLNYDTFIKIPSIGTLVEKGWSDGNKLIIIISSKEITHPFVTENTVIVETLKEAIDLIKGLQ